MEYVLDKLVCFLFHNQPDASPVISIIADHSGAA